MSRYSQALRYVPVNIQLKTPRGNNVNKNDLIDAIAADADLSKVSAARALDAAIGAITGALSKGGSVSLVGFGTFSVKARRRVRGATRVQVKPSKSRPRTRLGSRQAGA